MTSEFWQNEIERLTSRLLDRCLAGRDKVRYDEIAEQDIPEVFFYMVKLFMRKHFADESPIVLNHSPRYDFDSAGFRENCETFKQEVLARTLVSSAELETLAQSALTLESDILIRPRVALLELVFQGRNECHRADVLTVARGFGERRAFVERIVTHFKNLDQDQITKDDVQAIARKAEHTVYRETPVSALLTEVLLYQQFEARATGETQSMVRSQIVLSILENRELNGLLDEVTAQAGEKEFWTLTEIESSLERHLLVGTMDEPRSSSKAGQQLAGRLSPHTTRQDLRQKSRSNETRERFEAMQFNFLDDPGFEEPGDNPPPAEELTEELIHHLADDETPHNNGHGVNSKGRPTEEEKDDSPAEPFAVGVETADRDLIIKTVFEDDEAAYDAFMKSLATMDEWVQAKRAIDQELARRDIDGDTEEAVRLGDIVFAQFLSKR